MNKIIKFFSFGKPRVTAKLIKKGSQAKVKMYNLTDQNEILILLFLMTKALAPKMRMEHRQLMNKVIEMDKVILKNHKLLEKKVKGYKK